jgi:hypothetical protein
MSDGDERRETHSGGDASYAALPHGPDLLLLPHWRPKRGQLNVGDRLHRTPKRKR